LHLVGILFPHIILFNLQVKVHPQLIYTLKMMTNKFQIPLQQYFLEYLLMIMNYRLLFCGSSSNSAKIFSLQKNIRIMLGSISRDSCTNLFMKLKILPLPSQYVSFLFFSLWSKIETNTLLTPRFIIQTLVNTQIFINFYPASLNIKKALTL